MIHVDSLEVLDDLSKNEIAELFMAIKNFHNGKEEKLSAIVKVAFSSFKNQFVRDNDKYKKTCNARAKAGSLGGKQKVANASKSKQKVANLADSDSDSDSDSKLHRGEIKKNLIEYLSKFDKTNDPEKYANWFFGNYTEKNIEKSLETRMVTSVDKLIEVLNFNKQQS